MKHDVSMELFDTYSRNNTDLRKHTKKIKPCFQDHLSGYTIIVREKEVVIKDYPEETLPRHISRAISADLMNLGCMKPCIKTICYDRLLQKKKS